MKPIHVHDCVKCKFLCSVHMPEGEMDWYTCGGGPMTTIIARRSDEGSDYWSLPISLVTQFNWNVSSFLDGSNPSHSGMFILAKAILAKYGDNTCATPNAYSPLH